MILVNYPPDVMLKAIDPYKGLPSKCKFLPAPSELRDECDSWYSPILKEDEYAARERSQIAERIPDYRPRSAAHRRYEYRECLEIYGPRFRPVGPFEQGSKWVQRSTQVMGEGIA